MTNLRIVEDTPKPIGLKAANRVVAIATNWAHYRTHFT